MMKNKAVLANLLNLMARLTHNVRNFNGQVLTTTKLLKKNESPTPYLIHQPFLAYFSCPNLRFHDYVTWKKNFEDGIAMKPEYLMKSTRYKQPYSIKVNRKPQIPSSHKSLPYKRE